MSTEPTPAPATALAAPPIEEPAGAQRRRRPKREVMLWAAVAWVALISLLALLAEVLPLADWDTAAGSARMRPFTDWSEPLGTDGHGRSILARLVFGARASLAISLGAAAIGTAVGALLGLFAGYAKGRVDAVVSFIVDVVLAFPPLLILLTLASVLRPSISTLLVGLGLLAMPTIARLERAAAISWSQRPFVIAARSYGAGHLRLMFREILPNSAMVLITYAPTLIAALMVAEGALSYLGLGIPAPNPSWGGMIKDGRPELRTAPHLVFLPSVTVFLTVLSLNVIGERTRRRLESRER